MTKKKKKNGKVKKSKQKMKKSKIENNSGKK